MMPALRLSANQVHVQAQIHRSRSWSFVKAYDEDTHAPPEKRKPKFPKERIPGFKGMPLVERLKAVDSANEVFRYSYEEVNGEYFRIPLLRDRNVNVRDIRQKISGAAYKRAQRILEGVPKLDRISRAVPYSELHFAVREFVEENNASIDDVVVVGIDRGGRIPAMIMKEALGKSRAYFLKVDQGGGRLDMGRLMAMAQAGDFENKYVLFVDSTVDSGRQIKVLERILAAQDTNWKGWGIAGSNDDGIDMGTRHRNINWGIDPDDSFEDDPRLLGIDYADSAHIKVKAVPSMSSTQIRKAILEVPSGVVYNFSAKQKSHPDAVSRAGRIAGTRKWRSITGSHVPVEEPALGSHDAPQRKLRLAVSGSSNGANRFSQAYLEQFGKALQPYVEILYAGTEKGAPGHIMRGIAAGIDEVVVVRPDSEKGRVQAIRGNAGIPNLGISFFGNDKAEHRYALSKKGNAHLVLDGGEGTLAEALASVYAGNPVIVLASSNVGRYLSSTPSLGKRNNVQMVDNLDAALQRVAEFAAR
jgi:hypoxanthine phosphoribosyltransferase